MIVEEYGGIIRQIIDIANAAEPVSVVRRVRLSALEMETFMKSNVATALVTKYYGDGIPVLNNIVTRPSRKDTVPSADVVVSFYLNGVLFVRDDNL